MPAIATVGSVRRLTQEEADQICAKHDRLWAAKPGGARAVFAWMDLTGLSFRGRADRRLDARTADGDE